MFSLPSDILSLRGDPFYRVVEQFCGTEAVELLKFQFIDSPVNLLEIDDVFSILQFESNQTTLLKEILGVSGRNESGCYSFFVFPGIRLKMEKFIRSLRFLLQSMNSSSSSNTKSLTITPDLLQQHPFLIDLIHCLESNLLSESSLDFISNLVSNLVHTKNFFRYKQSVKDFAASVYILGGRNVYQLIRLNISVSLPSLTTLRTVISSSKYHFVAGEFQYSSLKDFTNSFDCKYALWRR